jgi:septation ring formation regulator EzrA
MNDEQLQNNLGKIEKLIVDGNKEVLKRLDKLEEGQRSLEDGQKTLVDGQQRLERKVDRIDNTLNATTHASYGLLTDVQKDVKEVKDTLDKHVRLPAHA